MTITVAGIAFSHHHYDERGDVLYLNVGVPRSAARGLEIDGGHTVHYDESNSIIGLTLLNIRRTLGARLGVVRREGRDESEISCADDEVESLAPLSGSEAALLNVLGMARWLWQNSASACVEH